RHSAPLRCRTRTSRTSATRRRLAAPHHQNRGSLMSVTRRDFLSTGATAATGFALGAPTLGASAPREAAEPFAGRPVVVSSANGIRGVKVAYDQIVKGGDPLDAVIAGVNIQELDPDDQSVGLGG